MSSSGEQKRAAAALFEKFQQLGAITNSTALNEISIVTDATKYIEELKQKVETMTEAAAGNSNQQVEVETLEKGFLIKVFSTQKKSQGLLVSILEAIEELGLHLLEATASCADNFQLEAVGGGENEGEVDGVDAELVKQAVLQAIHNYQQ